MASMLENILQTIGVERTKPTPTKEVGSSGTVIYGGLIDHREKNAALTGDRRYATFQNLMVNTSVVAASARHFLNLIAKADWKVEPADDTDAAKQAAEFVEEVLDQMVTPWNRIVSRQATYKFHGFATQEWVAVKRKDGRYGLHDIAMRPQPTIKKWDVDEFGNVLGCVQENPTTFKEKYLPRGKLLYTVDDTLSDSPDGLGLARQLIEPAERLEMLLKLERVGYENDLHGMPVARAPLNELRNLVKAGKMTPAKLAESIQFMKDFVQYHKQSPDRGILLDSATYRNVDEAQSPSSIRKWDVEMMRGDGAGTIHANIHNAIERINREMARITGTEFMLLGSDGGAYALSADKTSNFYRLVDSALTELGQSAEWDILWPLWKLNGLDEDLMPKLKPEAIQFRDVENITRALKDMAQAGVTLDPRDPACEEVRDLLGLSKTPMELIEEVMDQKNSMIAGLRTAGADALNDDPGSTPPSTEDADDDVPDPEEDDSN